MKKLFAFIRLDRAMLRHPRAFYLGFFLLYSASLFFLLFYVNGLSPFKLNIHYFSNVLGSLSKRALSDMAPYALIFYALYHGAKKKWIRAWLISAFFIIFSINALTIGYYFIARANFQFYVLEGFEWHIFFTFLTPLITLTLFGLAIGLFSSSNALRQLRATEEILPAKKWLFTLLFLALAIGSPFIPVKYSTHQSIRGSDVLEKDFFRTVELENSGLTMLINELKFTFFPPKRVVHTFTADESALIQEKNLDSNLQKNLPKPFKKIILVVVESLSQQFLSKYNSEIPVSSPRLDQLMAEYPHLDAFYPSGSFTLHGLASSLCGHPNLDQTLKNPTHECVPKLLKAAGYATEFIRGATKYYVEENVHFKKFGFDSVFAKEEFAKQFPAFIEEKSKLYKGWGYTDNYIFDEGIDRLKKAKPNDKLLLTLLTLDTHVPGGRCSYGQTPQDPEYPVLFSVHCFDRVFGEFMDRIQKENLLTDDTAILMVADHPYPSYFEIPGANFQTSFVMKPNLIPFLMITKNKLPLVAKQGSHVDIAATLLNLANQPTPPYYMGKSLISNPNTIPVGQDRENGYMVVNNKFFPLSLDPEIQELNRKEPAKGFELELTDGSPAEFQALIQAKVDEKESLRNQEDVYFKWYYNKFFNME